MAHSVMTHSVETLHKRVNYVLTRHGGGFRVYWALTWKLAKQLRDLADTTKALTDRYPWRAWAVFALKLPWWLFLKPLGWLISVETRYKGSLTVRRSTWEGETRTNDSVVKTVTVKALRFLPIFYMRSTELTPLDWERLLE